MKQMLNTTDPVSNIFAIKPTTPQQRSPPTATPKTITVNECNNNNKNARSRCAPDQKSTFQSNVIYRARSLITALNYSRLPYHEGVSPRAAKQKKKTSDEERQP